MKAFSGQVQSISLVIVSGIVIALVGVAYFWGMPLIEKRTTVTEVKSAKSFISELNEKLTELVKTGAGRAEIDVPNKLIRLVPADSTDPENNSIIMEFVVDQPMIYPNTTVYLKDFGCEKEKDGPTFIKEFTTCVGLYGTNSPDIISLKEIADVEGKFIMKIKLHYRELDTEERGYKIQLCPAKTDCETPQTGKSKIRLSFNKNIILPNAAANGKDLVATYINVELV